MFAPPRPTRERRSSGSGRADRTGTDWQRATFRSTIWFLPTFKTPAVLARGHKPHSRCPIGRCRQREGPNRACVANDQLLGDASFVDARGTRVTLGVYAHLFDRPTTRK